MVSFIAGHCNINRDLNLIDASHDLNCKVGAEVEETLEHILTSCPSLPVVSRRLEIFQAPLLFSPTKWSFIQLARYLRVTSIATLLDHKWEEQTVLGRTWALPPEGSLYPALTSSIVLTWRSPQQQQQQCKCNWDTLLWRQVVVHPKEWIWFGFKTLKSISYEFNYSWNTLRLYDIELLLFRLCTTWGRNY